MVFDATKVTYNTYSCTISGMSRESMKMDGRDSVECQNWEKKDIIGIKGKDLNDNKTKHSIVFVFSNAKKGGKRELEQGRGRGFRNGVFSVRESSFSLEIRAIRLSAVFKTRREAALRGEGFAWVPDLGSILKLREVEVSPYLGFILRLSTM